MPPKLSQVSRERSLPLKGRHTFLCWVQVVARRPRATAQPVTMPPKEKEPVEELDSDDSDEEESEEQSANEVAEAGSGGQAGGMKKKKVCEPRLCSNSSSLYTDASQGCCLRA